MGNAAKLTIALLGLVLTMQGRAAAPYFFSIDSMIIFCYNNNNKRKKKRGELVRWNKPWKS